MDSSNYNRTRGLIPLDQLDELKVADGYTDIRGFEAYNERGDRVGDVNQLLVDPEDARVAAVTIDVDRDLLHAGREPRATVPIEHVEIDTPGRRVVVQGGGVEYLGVSSAPSANRGDTSEQRIVLAEEELALRKQRVSAGAVDVQKHVEIEHVRETVPVMREEVTVERRPAQAGASMETRFDGDEIRIPIIEEELVIEKRKVVREELVIRKRQVQDQRVVEADLRKERADVRREGDVREVNENPGSRNPL